MIFEQGQSISLCVRVLSVVINGVEQAVTGGSLRHSRVEKSKDSAMNAVKESVSFDLSFPYCLAWLCCLVEIVGNSFFYDLVIGFSAYQTPYHPFVALRMGVQCQVSQSISYCRDIGRGCLMGLMTVGWENRRDERCLIARGFLGLAILVYLGWVSFVGIMR